MRPQKTSSRLLAMPETHLLGVLFGLPSILVGQNAVPLWLRLARKPGAQPLRKRIMHPLNNYVMMIDIVSINHISIT